MNNHCEMCGDKIPMMWTLCNRCFNALCQRVDNLRARGVKFYTRIDPKER